MPRMLNEAQRDLERKLREAAREFCLQPGAALLPHEELRRAHQKKTRAIRPIPDVIESWHAEYGSAGLSDREFIVLATAAIYVPRDSMDLPLSLSNRRWHAINEYVNKYSAVDQFGVEFTARQLPQLVYTYSAGVLRRRTAFTDEQGAWASDWADRWASPVAMLDYEIQELTAGGINSLAERDLSVNLKPGSEEHFREMFLATNNKQIRAGLSGCVSRYCQDHPKATSEQCYKRLCRDVPLTSWVKRTSWPMDRSGTARDFFSIDQHIGRGLGTFINQLHGLEKGLFFHYLEQRLVLVRVLCCGTCNGAAEKGPKSRYKPLADFNRCLQCKQETLRTSPVLDERLIRCDSVRSANAWPCAACGSYCLASDAYCGGDRCIRPHLAAERPKLNGNQSKSRRRVFFDITDEASALRNKPAPMSLDEQQAYIDQYSDEELRIAKLHAVDGESDESIARACGKSVSEIQAIYRRVVAGPGAA